MEWPKMPIKSIAEVVSGFGFPCEEQGKANEKFPFFKVNDMNQSGNEVEMRNATNTVSADVLATLGAKALPPGTVIFPKIGAAIATGKKRLLVSHATFDNNVMGLVPFNLVDSRFLYFWSLTFDFQKIANIGPVPSLRKSTVENIIISLPLLSEQRRIVEILDQAGHLRKLSAQAKDKAEHILPALFIKMFGDPATNTSMWPKQPFSALVEIGTKLVDPTQSEFSDFPHIGGEQIEKNSGRILDYKLVKDSDLRSSKFIFSEKHILYSKIRPYLNKVAFPQFKGLCSADIYPLLPKHPAITPWYLVAALRTQAFLSYALTCSNRLRMPKLNKEQLGAFLLSVPDMKTVAIFEDQAELIAKMILHRAKVNEQTESLFLILLHRAFSGNLTAAWREAHMKELLVEMEQQTKALNDH
jgi:type I restriction enzyme, S subunit